jgi:hypothetical protein
MPNVSGDQQRGRDQRDRRGRIPDTRIASEEGGGGGPAGDQDSEELER